MISKPVVHLHLSTQIPGGLSLSTNQDGAGTRRVCHKPGLERLDDDRSRNRIGGDEGPGLGWDRRRLGEWATWGREKNLTWKQSFATMEVLVLLETLTGLNRRHPI
jgi:hypothetical protein